MSAIGAAAPAAPASATRARRPATLTVLRWELRKLLSQKRTYLGLAIAVVFPLIFVVVQNVHTHHGGDNIFSQHVTESGLATPVLMLFYMSTFFLPLAAVLVAGDIVSAEDGNGTLKTILTRSVDRSQVLLAKVLAAVLFAVLVIVLCALVATLAGVASWGFRHVVTFSGTVVPAPKGLLLVVAAYGCYLIPLLTVAAIALMLSTVTRNSVAGVAGALAFTFLILLLAVIPGLEGVKPYLLTNQYEAWHGLLRTPTDWAPVLHSLWVCALYAVPSLLVAYLYFLRRDVAGG